MAQWMGQFTGNTHLTKVQDRELQLRHAVEVYRSKRTTEERQASAENVIRLAERLLNARIRATKANIAARDPRDDQGRVLATQKITGLVDGGIRAILEEFDVSEIAGVD